MQLSIKTLFVQSLLVAWLIVCLVLSVSPGSTSQTQMIILRGWQTRIEVFARIPLLQYTLDLLHAGLGALLFSLACLSLGLGVLQKGRILHANNLAQAISAFIVGEILLSVIFLTLISIYRLEPLYVGILLLIGFLTGFSALKSFVIHVSYPHTPLDFEWYESIILGLELIIIVVGLLFSSTRLSYDAVTEYFSHAKIMAMSQLPIFFQNKDPFVVSSFHSGILFSAVIQLFGDQSARMLSWINGMVIVAMALAIGNRLGLTSRSRLWLLALIVTSTAFVDLLGDGKIELISSAPIITAIYWMLESLENPTKSCNLLIGLLLGFAVISRPYNIFLVSVFTILFYISQIYIKIKHNRRFDIYSFFRYALWALPPILILVFFHLVENWLILKNPLAPLSYAHNVNAAAWQWQFDPANLVLYRLLYPVVVTFLNTPQSLGNVSPLVIGFLPFLLTKKIRENLNISSALYGITISVVITLTLWISLFFTVMEIRYVLFLWILGYLIVAKVIENAIQYMAISTRPIILILIIILLAAFGGRSLLISLITYSPIDGNGQAHCYDIASCTFLNKLNNDAMPGDRILVLNSARYYLRPDLFACSSESNEYQTLEVLARQNSPGFWIETYRQGYHFITFEENFANNYIRFGDIPDPKGAPSWLKVTAFFSTSHSAEFIYKIDAVNPPFQANISCQKNSQGIWQLQSVAP